MSVKVTYFVEIVNYSSPSIMKLYRFVLETKVYNEQVEGYQSSYFNLFPGQEILPL